MVEIQQARLQQAGLTALGLFAFLVVVLYSRLPSVLPGYPAVIVAFAVWGVLPGWFLQRALFATKSTGLVERVAVAFLMSMALASVPGLVGLRLHWSVESFGLAYAAVAAVASGLSILLRREDHDTRLDEDADQPASGISAALTIALIVAVAVVLFVTSSNLPRDGDDLVYLGYVNNYLATDTLNAADVFPRQGAFARMGFNVWVVIEALLTDSAGVSAVDLIMDYLPPIMTLMTLAAMFALAQGLFRQRSIGLLAVVFVLGFGLLDLSAYEGYGRNIFLRIAQDKMVATYVLLPVALLLVTRFVERARSSSYIAVVMALLALFIVHPIGVVFLGIAALSLVVVRLVSQPARAALRSGALLLTPWAVLSAAYLLRVLTTQAKGSDLSGVSFTFRRELRIDELGGGFLIGDYHMLLHPLVVLAVVAAPLVWLASPGKIGRQVLMATVAGVILVFFVPFLATPVDTVASELAVWRLPGLIPVPLILAAACFAISGELVRRVKPGSLVSKYSMIVGPAAVAVVVLAGAFFVQEQYVLADEGTFYSNLSDSSIFPWINGSITIGGFVESSSEDARPNPEILTLLEYLETNVEAGSVVLAHPRVSRYISGMLPRIRVVPDAATGARGGFLRTFYSGWVYGQGLTEALNTRGVDYVLVESKSPGENALRTFAAFDAIDFSPGFGLPELGLRVAGAETFQAWAMDPDQIERLVGPRFRVPADIDLSDLTLELDLVVAPSGNVRTNSAARVAFSYTNLNDQQAEPAITLTKVSFPAGTDAGTWEMRRRTLSGTVEPGGEYRIVFWRGAEGPTDTYTEDIWFIRLAMKYTPKNVEEIEGTTYRIYDRGDALEE